MEMRRRWHRQPSEGSGVVMRVLTLSGRLRAYRRSRGQERTPSQRRRRRWQQHRERERELLEAQHVLEVRSGAGGSED